MPSFDIFAYIQKLVLLLPGFLLAITCHEAAHGYVAYKLGDPTPKMAGRLTLNPFKHLDVVGTLVLVLTRMIGWAKPVPVDPRFFKNPQRGMMLVGLAGPAANFVLAVVFTICLKGCAHVLLTQPSPLEVRLFLPLALICKEGVLISLVLGFFNLLPIPPLDGSNILAGFMPLRTAMRYMSFGRYGFIVIVLLAVTGVLGQILQPAVMYAAQLLL